MARKYIVISLAISGKGNKIFKFGNEVKEGETNTPLEQLVKEGHLKVEESTDENAPIETDKEAENKEGETNTPLENEANKEQPTLLVVVDKNGAEIQVKNEADLNKKQIIAELEARNIEFNSMMDKATLFELLVARL